MKYGEHYSVLNREIIDLLIENKKLENKRIYADLTFGAGGHTFALASISNNINIYCTDQDPQAFSNGQNLIKTENLEDRVHLLKMNFIDFPSFAKTCEAIINHGGFDGIVMDLGVSSHQFDTAERGFSYRFDGPLDMRMDFDNNNTITAADVLNTFDEVDIANILYEYGEERLSRKIAAKVVSQRKIKKFETTKDFEEICFLAYPASQRHGSLHPATRSFQALRIFVNRELEVLRDVIPNLFNLLKIDGKLAIISFHSLEDRIVKHTFKEIVDSHKNMVKLITKKPILPSEAELSDNKRSRSAKLRVIEKTDGVMDGEIKKKHKYKKEKKS